MRKNTPPEAAVGPDRRPTHRVGPEEQENKSRAEGLSAIRGVLRTQLPQEILADACKHGKEVVVAWLDLTNAFGSVPRVSIHETLRRHQVRNNPRRLIRSVYTDVTTQVR